MTANTSDSVCFDVTFLTDEQISQNFLYKPAEEIIFKFVLPAIILTGFLGNMFFLFVVCSLPRTRTVTNIYLCNLSIADILFLFFGAGEKFLRVFLSPVSADRFFFQQSGCIIIIFMINFSSIASLLLVTLVTVERYYAISRPVQHRLIAGRSRTVKFIAGAWATSFIISTTIVPSHSVFSTFCFLWPDKEHYDAFPTQIGICNHVAPWLSDYSNGVQTIPFFVALLLNLYMYVAIIRSLYRRVDPHTNSVSASTARMRLVVAWMVIINGIVFFCCNALFNLISAMFMVSSLASDTQTVIYWYNTISPFHVLLLYINSMINPFIYGATNQRLRKAFFLTMRCSVKETSMTEGTDTKLSGTKQLPR
ncbi:Substance-K receptor [Holothuria leucospilota]|uniref:Substance-K receptor n=1 Tax=Holothuria leucospilota TaxID=206669 RepID=A0A9Q1BLJ3_HOLLE|nr:Substance-K receptor [Holothuria leucospilota]